MIFYRFPTYAVLNSYFDVDNLLFCKACESKNATDLPLIFKITPTWTYIFPLPTRTQTPVVSDRLTEFQ